MWLIFLNRNFRKSEVVQTSKNIKAISAFQEKQTKSEKSICSQVTNSPFQSLLVTAQRTLSSFPLSTARKPGKALLHAANT